MYLIDNNNQAPTRDYLCTGEGGRTPTERVCSVIVVNNDRTMEMESNHSMYFLVPLYNSQSGRNMTIIWRFLVVF